MKTPNSKQHELNSYTRHFASVLAVLAGLGLHATSMSAEPPLEKLADLKGGDYVLRITHIAKSPIETDGGGAIRDKSFAPAKGKRTRVLKVSADLKKVTMSGEAASGRLSGKADKQWVYHFDSAPGGSRLSIRESATGLLVEFARFGSGVPVIEAYRGILSSRASEASKEGGEEPEEGPAGYTGDGEFTDNGARAASMRYVLDLGAVDLLADSASSYKLSGLPSAEFVAGLCLEMPHPFDQARDIKTTKPEWFDTLKVSLSLIETGTGREVFKVDRSLADLTWSNGSPKPKTSFLYGRDDDASTSFDADGKAAYELRVGIDSSGSGGVPATLLLYGGGRKVASP